MSTSENLHFSSLVIDSHCDTVLRVIRSQGAFRLRDEHTEGHVDIPRLKKGGVGLQFFAAYIGPEYKPDRSIKRTLQLLDCLYTELDDNQDSLHLVLDSGNLEEARRLGKIGVLLSIEGGEALEGDIAMLRVYHRLGVRALGLTWNERNQIAEGVGDCRSGGGLSAFGVKVVEEMNRLGMIVDVSHLSEPGFFDVLEVSRHPIIASHSNSRAVCDHVRNLTDKQIKALAENGGVMGLNMAHEFIVAGGHPTIDHVIDHVDHVANLLGNTAHIGLGGDYDGITKPPIGLEDMSKYPALTDALLRRGYNEAQVRQILGENHLRVIKTVIG